MKKEINVDEGKGEGHEPVPCAQLGPVCMDVRDPR